LPAYYKSGAKHIQNKVYIFVKGHKSQTESIEIINFTSFLKERMNHPLIKILLSPFALIYWVVTAVRNLFFDFRILPSKSFDIPVVSVGNVSVGGTGKTPHVEFLLKTFKDEFKLATLSRGYKRKSTGFILANDSSTVNDLGDEPFQMKQKFGDVDVAVHANRVEGIEKLLEEVEGLDMLVLDDAFQHRYVNPGKNILLVDYNRNIWKDMIMPAGRLRESRKGRYRADIIIMSKCPQDLSFSELRSLQYQMKLSESQYMYFTYIKYGEIVPVFSAEAREGKKILLVSGIAFPKPLLEYLEKEGYEVESISFPDHHHFTKEDLLKIEKKKKEGNFDFILTTEKDAVRMQCEQAMWESIQNDLFYIPIEIDFLNNKKEEFINNILSYARNNKRDNILYQRKG